MPETRRRPGSLSGGLRPSGLVRRLGVLTVQACLGLEINAPEAEIHFNRPRLPAVLDELRIHNLEVAGATVDLLLDRHEEGIGINVLRREGDVQITVEQ